MKYKYLLALFIIFFFSTQLAHAARLQILKPGPECSLRPLIEWAPLEGKVKYIIKIKEYNTEKGEYHTLIKETTRKNSFRPEQALTENNYYKIYVIALMDEEEIATETIFTKAIDKFIVIGHSALDEAGHINEFEPNYARIRVEVDGQNTSYFWDPHITPLVEGELWWFGVANFVLPQGAIITGFTVHYYLREINPTESATSFGISRSANDATPTADEIFSSGTSGGFGGGGYITDIHDLTSIAFSNNQNVVNNAQYQYQLEVSMQYPEQFHRAEIHYAD